MSDNPARATDVSRHQSTCRGARAAMSSESKVSEGLDEGVYILALQPYTLLQVPNPRLR